MKLACTLSLYTQPVPLKFNPQVHDAAPPGAKVLHGQQERENEAKFDERAMTPAKGLAAGGGDGGTIGEGSGVTGIERNRAAAAGAPAGDDEHLLATGEKGEKIK